MKPVPVTAARIWLFVLAPSNADGAPEMFRMSRTQPAWRASIGRIEPAA